MVPILSCRKKNGGRQVTEKTLTSNEKKEMWEWLNASLKSTKTSDELSSTCNPNVL